MCVYICVCVGVCVSLEQFSQLFDLSLVANFLQMHSLRSLMELLPPLIIAQSLYPL